MLILGDGSIRGTVGGGALEGGIIKAAPEVMRERRARIIDVVLDGADEAAPDVICGGTAVVLVDYINAENPGNLDFFTQLRSVLRSGARARLLTAPPVQADTSVRSQCIIMPDGPPRGTSGLDPAILKTLESAEGSYDVFTRLENRKVYLHSIGTDGIAYIFGAGHCGEKLAQVLGTVGFGTIVIDDRAEFANTERFPAADGIIVPESMDQPFCDIEMDGDSYIVIVTRGHAHDELVLRGALRTQAGYIGMIGSRRKRETIYKNLLEDGYKQSDIDRVYSPIGVNIGAETPEEIAVSIAAEMIKARSDKRD